MIPAIEIRDLVVSYGKRRVLDGLSLSVSRGEIFGFLGPNGTGKSTTIKVLLGLLFPASGRVRVDGFAPSDVRSRARVGFLPEEAIYYRFLTPVELLKFYGALCGVPGNVLKTRVQRLVEWTGLSAVADRRIGTFSKGMVQKLGLAQALVNDPEILVLDEPASGLDPLARIELRSFLKHLKQEGKTIFFSSHELSEVELLCDTVAILKSGKLVRSGPLSEVVDRGQESLERFFIRTITGGDGV
jgi:ABC-2 type transport system ATP-binding protein